jgi:hypothetical protein
VQSTLLVSGNGSILPLKMEVQVRSKSLWIAASSILLAVVATAQNAFVGSVPEDPGADIFVTPIADAPFSGVVFVTRSIVQPDGSVGEFRTIHEIGRDSEGRIHNEMRTLVPVSSDTAPEIVQIHIYDPLYRTNEYLNPRLKTFRTSVVNHPPHTEPPDLDASPTGANLPASQFAAHEDLGIHELDGLEVHGVRKTQAIPADANGTGKIIYVIDEYWYSAELRMNLMRKHSDPRTGSVTMTVTQIKRGNPDPSFFEIPSDYTQAEAAVRTRQ